MLDIISKIIESKANQCPKQRFAIFTEIAKESGKSDPELTEDLNELVRSVILTHGRTSNDIYFKIK